MPFRRFDGIFWSLCLRSGIYWQTDWKGNVSFFCTDPRLNVSGENHVYSTSYAGGGNIPVGTYVGFEDTAFNRGSDKNYADLQFVFTNTAAQTPGDTSIPKPASIVLLGEGGATSNCHSIESDNAYYGKSRALRRKLQHHSIIRRLHMRRKTAL